MLKITKQLLIQKEAFDKIIETMSTEASAEIDRLEGECFFQGKMSDYYSEFLIAKGEELCGEFVRYCYETAGISEDTEAELFSFWHSDYFDITKMTTKTINLEPWSQ